MYNGRTYQKDQGEDKIARNYVPPDDGLPTPPTPAMGTQTATVMRLSRMVNMAPPKC